MNIPTIELVMTGGWSLGPASARSLDASYLASDLPWYAGEVVHQFPGTAALSAGSACGGAWAGDHMGSDVSQLGKQLGD